MSARLEDLKFMLTLSAVVLFGSGLDIIPGQPRRSAPTPSRP